MPRFMSRDDVVGSSLVVAIQIYVSFCNGSLHHTIACQLNPTAQPMTSFHLHRFSGSCGCLALISFDRRHVVRIPFSIVSVVISISYLAITARI